MCARNGIAFGFESILSTPAAALELLYLGTALLISETLYGDR